MGAASRGLITGDEFVSGELIFVYPGTDPADYPADTAGKIVLMERASSTSLYRTQVANAEAAGAGAVILYSLVGSRGNYGGAWNPSLSSSSPAGIPVLGAALIQGEWLKDMLAQGPVALGLCRPSTMRIWSLSMSLASNRPKARIRMHPPSWLPAIWTVSSALPELTTTLRAWLLVLELARVLRGYNTDKELRFILFGSEERGLRGSRYYLDQLSDAEQGPNHGCV